MQTQIPRQFVIGNAIDAWQRLQAGRAASFSVLQNPFRLSLFGRPGAFPDRPACTIVFDPEHLASFVEHAHGSLLLLGGCECLRQRWQLSRRIDMAFRRALF